MYVTDRERESIHMLIDKMPYDEWRAFVSSSGDDPDEIEDRNTWYTIKDEEDSYDSDISNRLRESMYSDEESQTDQNHQVFSDHRSDRFDSSPEFEFEFTSENVQSLALGSTKSLKNKRKSAVALAGVAGKKRITKKIALGALSENRNNGNDKTEGAANKDSSGIQGGTVKQIPKRRSSNNSFCDRPAGKTRYEESIDKTVYVPKGYCTAAVSRGKPFCSQCMLKPCVMEKDKSDFDNMWCNLEIIHCRPSRYVERKLRGFARSKMVQYFGPTYVDSLPNNGVPACFDARLTYYIDSDCESGDEPDGDDTDYGAIVRACIIKSKEKKTAVKSKEKKTAVRRSI